MLCVLSHLGLYHSCQGQFAETGSGLLGDFIIWNMERKGDMSWQFDIFRLAVLTVRCDCGSSLTVVMFFLPALSCRQKKIQLKLN